jgi:hypothetical protein
MLGVSINLELEFGWLDSAAELSSVCHIYVVLVSQSTDCDLRNC